MMRVLFTWLFCGCLALQAAEVTAELSADVVEVGKGAMLTLQVEGGSPDAQPTIPPVKDLVVNPRGQSQQVRIVNGRVSRSIGYNYVVGSHVAGEYEIPSIVVRVNGEALLTEPLKLTVRPSASGEPEGMEEESGAAEDAGEYGHLTFSLVKKDREHVYPGEIAPVRIQAYFPIDARISLKGAPRPEGSAFTLHNLSDQPEQGMKVVDGKRYRVLTWYGGLSATKAGHYPASFSLDGTVAVRDRSARRRPSAIEDPFFGRSMLDDFFAPMIEKDVSLRTEEPTEVEVTELPAEGRPDDFTGAIGRFEFESARLPASMRTGEPARVSARIRGEGNFALLKQPEPLPVDDWKTYEGSDRFTPGDLASFGGTKDFEFNVVPRKPGTKAVVLGFSYFDPDAGEYRQVESVSQKVEITGAALAERKPAEAAPEPQAPEEPKLAPIRRDLGREGAYEPLSGETWFAPVVAGCGLLSLAILGLGAWRVRHDDPDKAARRAARVAEERALAAAAGAVAKGDGVAFFTAAREALRLRLAESRGIRPEAVTWADLEGCVDERVMELWRVADRLDYSGEAGEVGALGEWQAMLRLGMESLSEERRAA